MLSRNLHKQIRDLIKKSIKLEFIQLIILFLLFVRCEKINISLGFDKSRIDFYVR